MHHTSVKGFPTLVYKLCFHRSYDKPTLGIFKGRIRRRGSQLIAIASTVQARDDGFDSRGAAPNICSLDATSFFPKTCY